MNHEGQKMPWTISLVNSTFSHICTHKFSLKTLFPFFNCMNYSRARFIFKCGGCFDSGGKMCCLVEAEEKGQHLHENASLSWKRFFDEPFPSWVGMCLEICYIKYFGSIVARSLMNW